ncbi:MAG: hypothetical protein ACYCZN_00510 [Candidatus Dormibacteria bacterium]
MSGKILTVAVGLVFASLSLAACGTASTPRASGPSLSPHGVISPPAPSPSPLPSPTATATAGTGSRVDVTFRGALAGTMTVLQSHACSAATGTVSVALQGLVAGRSYWLTLEIVDPGLSAGSWSLGSPPSQRQGGLENSTPQVGPTASSPIYGAAPGSSGSVALTGDPATATVLDGTIAATLVPVGSNSGTASLAVSGDFSCQLH